MSKTMAAFYEGPPYLEMLNRIQQNYTFSAEYAII